MSILALQSCNQLQLPITEKALLNELCRISNDALKCWPSQQTIASRLGCCSRTVLRTLKKLEAKALIFREQRKIGNARTSDMITVNLEAFPALTKSHGGEVMTKCHSGLVGASGATGDISRTDILSEEYNNTYTLTTTHRSLNVPLEKNLQGEAADAAETDSLREPLKKEDADLPKGKTPNDPKGRDADGAYRDKPQTASCQDNTHDTCSAGLARDENPQQAQQASARASGSAKTDFLQKAVEKMRNAAGDALSERMAKDFEPGRWLQGGYDLELDILPIIERRSQNRATGSIFTWSFFTNAIADWHGSRTAPLPKVEHAQDVRQRGQNTRKKGGSARSSQLTSEQVRQAMMEVSIEAKMELAA